MKNIIFLLIFKVIQVYTLRRNLFTNSLLKNNPSIINNINIIAIDNIDFLKKIPGFQSNAKLSTNKKVINLQDIIAFRLQVIEYDPCEILLNTQCDFSQNKAYEVLSEMIKKLRLNQLNRIKKEMDISFYKGLIMFRSYGKFNILNERLYYNSFKK